MKRRLSVLVFSSVFAGCMWTAAGAGLELVPDGDGRRFGDARLTIVFSGATGWPKAYCFDGRERMNGGKLKAAECRVRYLPVDGKGAHKTSGALRSAGFEKVSSDTVVSHMRTAGWDIDAFWRIVVPKRRIEVRFEVTRRGERVRMLYFFADMGALPFNNPSAKVVVPATWPRKEADAASGKFSFNNGDSPYPVIAQDGLGGTVTWFMNDLTDHADLGLAVVSDHEEKGADVTQYYYSAGFMNDGDRQTVGDGHVVFGKGDVDAALRDLPSWHAELGRHVVPDRPEWIRKAVLYSIHPLGTRKGARKDGRGLKGVAEYLDAIKALGCDTLWLQPILYNSAYNPSDYYRLQDGVGTEEDVAALSKAAHAKGLRVWHDMIPHGGDTNSVRFLRHPEWYAVQANGLPASYWACDFNHPGWCDYMSRVGEYWSRIGCLDGYRIDAAFGARHENWNPAIPYARASFSRLQGGFKMQKALRDAARRVTPDAAILSEANTDPFATVSDVLWDFRLGCEILHDLRTMPAREFVPKLRRWLHERTLASTPGLLFFRYSENHDLLKGIDVYGGAASVALSALTSLIDGVPGIVDGMEATNFDDYRRIFTLRRQVCGLNNGTVDYLSPVTPDGVFACTRHEGTNESVVVVNLNECPAAGLRPFEYALYNNGRRVRAEVGAFAAASGETESFSSPSTVSVSTNGFLVSTVMRIPGLKNWFASTAEGVFSSPLFKPHGSPEPARGYFYRLPQGGNVLLDGRIHPFGVSRDYALVGGDDGTRAWIGEVRPGVQVRLLNSFGGQVGFHVEFIAARKVVDVVRWKRVTKAEADACKRVAPGTGDDRLKPSVGGYVFEDGSLKVCFQRNGALRGAWRKSGNGWVRIADSGYFATEGVRKSYQSVATPTVYDQAGDAEPFATMRKTRDGQLVLQFKGELRNLRREGRMPCGTAYRTTYFLGGKDSRLETSFRLHPKGKTEETKFVVGDLTPAAGRVRFVGGEAPSLVWKGPSCEERGLVIDFAAIP